MTISTIYLEIQVEVEHYYDEISSISIINRTDFPSPISVNITDFLKANEVEQAGLAAMEEIAKSADRQQAIKEDRNRE